MLVTTIDQVRDVIGTSVRSDNTYDILEPYLKSAEEHLITELIGQQQLQVIYNAVSDQDLRLQDLVRKAVIWNGYLEAWYQAFYEFSGSGIGKAIVKDKKESLFRYQEDAIQKDIVRKADESVERLMAFLEINAGSYPLYKASQEFAANSAYLISSPGALHRSLPEVSKSFRMFISLRGYMDRVEAATVKVITGYDLYEDLKSKISSGEALDPNYKKLLRLAQDYTAPATLLEAMPWIRVQFSPNGIRIQSVLNNLQDETPLKDDQAKWLMGILEERMNSTKTVLRAFLNEVSSNEVFPDYFNSSLYRTPGSKQWVMPDNSNSKHFRF